MEPIKKFMEKRFPFYVGRNLNSQLRYLKILSVSWLNHRTNLIHVKAEVNWTQVALNPTPGDYRAQRVWRLMVCRKLRDDFQIFFNEVVEIYAEVDFHYENTTVYDKESRTEFDRFRSNNETQMDEIKLHHYISL